MNISSRCEYACRAVVELASHEPSPLPLTAEVIAGNRRIPEKFLVHILLQLKRAGIVRSVRGARGGYTLNQPPENITLLDVVRAIDGPVLQPLPVHDPGSEDISVAWRDVAAEIETILQRVTVKDILDRARKAAMFYI
ncbi:MAG: Rrf2 family transcriptional regulator [Candidatus Hydrogenedentes bacterium]|nr:Rrf2 family transcriptional regulator [Candidatus Hydrogenedentota bacterium]